MSSGNSPCNTEASVGVNNLTSGELKAKLRSALSLFKRMALPFLVV
jgi:hypothetical protein